MGAENIFGYKAEEVIGRPVSLLVPPGHTDEVPEILVRIKRGERIEQFETVRMRKGGTIIPVSLTFSAVKDSSGRIIGASKIAHDITKRKRAEETLRETLENNKFLANVVQSSSQAFGQGFPDGRLGLINKAFEQLTGYSEDELKTMDWSRVLTPPEWQEFERQKLSDLQRTGKPVRYEKEYIRKDGTRVPIELLVHLVNGPDGKPLYYYSFLTDITERKQAEEALRISEERLRYASIAGDIGTWHWDLATNELIWNERCKELFGYPPDYPMTYQAFLQPIHEEDRKGIDEAVRSALEDKKEYFVEMRVVLPDGQLRWVLNRGRGFDDNHGRPVRMHGIAMDITARKQVEEEIRRYVEELEFFNQAAVGRELRMIELKHEVNELCVQAGQPPRYDVDFEEEQP